MDRNQLSEADRLSLLLFRKITGSITADEQAELDRWAADNDRRREYAEQLANSYFLEEQYRRQKSINARRAMNQMQQRIDGTDKRQRLPQRVWRRAVAAIVIAVATGGIIGYRLYTRVTPPTISSDIRQAMHLSRQSGRSEAAMASVEKISISQAQGSPAKPSRMEQPEGVLELLAAKRVSTRSDKEFWLTLPDGSLVHLNYNTRVIYPEQFSGPTRDVILDGEAYFMVARDRRHPFVVHTPQGDITDHGTEFNVNTRGQRTEDRGESHAPSAETFTEVVLVEGSISVVPTNGTERMMNPGQKLSMINSQLSIDEVDIAPYVAWNTGKFSFSEWPLDRVMTVLARWYGFEQVEFTTDELRRKRIDGSFSRYDDVDNIIASIATALGLDITLQEKTIIIKNQTAERPASIS